MIADYRTKAPSKVENGRGVRTKRERSTKVYGSGIWVVGYGCAMVVILGRVYTNSTSVKNKLNTKKMI